MDLQQAKILLEKINTLYKSISISDGKVAAIEKDLMLSYLRQLYEVFGELDPDAGTIAAPRQETKIQADPEPEVAEPRSVERPKAVDPEPLKRKYVPPRIIEIPDSIKEMPAQPTPRATPPPKPQPKPKPQPQPVQAPVTASNSEVDILFHFQEAKELSEKLSQRPITDLTKAFSINDRLLYINDLFGKDQNALNTALNQLNGFSDMEEAKPLLVDLASRNDWTNKDRVDVAKTFINLVRRRYH